MTLVRYSIRPDFVLFIGEDGTRTLERGHPQFRDVVDALLLGVDPTELLGPTSKRYRVTLRALAPGLSGYLTLEYELGAVSAGAAEDRALEMFADAHGVSPLDVTTVSVTRPDPEG